jgi:SAM-dependent methyltransferase
MQHHGPVHRHIQDDLVHVVTGLDVQSILDVGCGSGENLARLAKLDRYELCGTEVSEEALSLAKRNAPNARLERLDVEREALPDRFDLVVSIQVVEHLRDDVTALRHMASMSAKYIFTSTLGGRMRPSERSIGHVRNYSSAELRRKHELAGLEVLWVHGWGFPFYSPLYRSAVELLPGGPPSGRIGPAGRIAARVLYHLYRLNVPGRGDVLSALARRG